MGDLVRFCADKRAKLEIIVNPHVLVWTQSHKTVEMMVNFSIS